MEALAAGAAQPISVDLQPISMDLDGAPSPEPTLYGTRQGAAATAAAATAAAATAAAATAAAAAAAEEEEEEEELAVEEEAEEADEEATPRHFAAIRAQLGPLRHTTPLCPHYMCRQVEISASMRRILVEWLIELHDELGLPTEALLHGIHHVDRFLAAQSVRKEALQLVGAVALMTACNSFCKLPTQVRP
jgi:hypothetical protein